MQTRERTITDIANDHEDGEHLDSWWVFAMAIIGKSVTTDDAKIILLRMADDADAWCRVQNAVEEIRRQD